MKNLHKTLALSLVVLLSMGSISTQEKEEIHKTFTGKKEVRIRTVSGDCIVRKGKSNQIRVDLVYSVRPKDAFKPEFREADGVIKLRERWYGSSSGRVTWTITVPPKTEIEFSTASGDLSVEGMNSVIEADTASGDIIIESSIGEFEINTASGDVEIIDSQGEFDISTASGEIDADNIQGFIELSTASGDIDIADSEGTFELSCASGDIDAEDIFNKEESVFSTASGSVYVQPSKSPQYDLELSAASGRVTLDYHGKPIKGYFEFTARKVRGRISSPFSFENEEEFERNDYVYVRKSFTKGGRTPRIYLRTATGRVTLKK